ncbi:MAG: TIGR01212 family radical SAM protein [Pseudomonadota bacterium]
MERRYNDYNTYLKSLFGQRVQKIVIDAGLSCPNRDGTLAGNGCIYCNSSGSGSGAFSRGLSIREQVAQGRTAMIRRYKAARFLAYFQSYTNTYTTVEHMKAMIDEAIDADGMVGFAMGTRPDCIDDGKLGLMAGYADRYLVWIEYGLQSVHDVTLKKINRGHDFACFERAVAMTRNRGINICAHVILGLPGETRDMMLDSARVLGGLGVHGVKIHLLYVIKGTPLAVMHGAGHYRCMEQEAYVETVCDFLERLPESIIIQRLTGDPHPDELIAPQWSRRKTETFAMIQSCLEARNTRQGRLYGV